MNSSHPTGLGEPRPVGKRSLFQPPPLDDRNSGSENTLPAPESTAEREPNHHSQENARPSRLRTTITLSRNAFQIVQNIQENHRLETGRVLPLWKVISRAIEDYGRQKDDNHV